MGRNPGSKLRFDPRELRLATVALKMGGHVNEAGVRGFFHCNFRG